jgi:putative SOS response-associated peptidase YedK
MQNYENYPTFSFKSKKMCGRYSFAVEDDLIRERFGVSVRSAVYKARYNCAPSQSLAVITNKDPSTLSFFRWGLIPNWAKDPKIGNKLINARSEGVLEKPSFRNAFRKRRCLVPADGFYVWRQSDKTPFRIIRKNRQPFAMAGIWEEWNDPEGQVVQTFSILTTEPNDLMAKLHNRMPVILSAGDEQKWLQETAENVLTGLLTPFPAFEMLAYPISRLVNSPANDNPSILEPAGDLLL